VCSCKVTIKGKVWLSVRNIIWSVAWFLCDRWYSKFWTSTLWSERLDVNSSASLYYIVASPITGLVTREMCTNQLFLLLLQQQQQQLPRQDAIDVFSTIPTESRPTPARARFSLDKKIIRRQQIQPAQSLDHCTDNSGWRTVCRISVYPRQILEIIFFSCSIQLTIRL